MQLQYAGFDDVDPRNRGLEPERVKRRMQKRRNPYPETNPVVHEHPEGVRFSAQPN